ncbi:secretin and TonB N-terminal domain-containing protein [Trinickia symbiotica]|nr:secretin and TonB N-terminal domain-containing protein [Trinickia symbiotica]
MTALLMFLMLVVRCGQAQEAERDVHQPAGAEHFDLPAQPLAQALQAFGRMTELVVLAPAPLLEGRTSAAVKGDYSPREALERVLTGTGLRPEFTGADEAIIVAEPAAAPAASSAASTDDSAANAALPIDGIGADKEQSAYAAMLQARLTEALCAQPAAVPGSYRLIAQLRIDDKGTVVAVNMVASSGLASRDAAIGHALRSLKLDSAPPSGLAQPVTIMLRPVGHGVHISCPQPGERE